MSRCTVPGCRREADLVYLDRGICTNHRNQLTADDVPPDALRMALGIKADAPAALEVDMSETKKTEAKTPKKVKAAKPRKEKAPKEDLVVFAFRLSPAERDAIHKAAGPGGASRFVRAVALAAAREDDAAFRQAQKEAREARA